jgi:hypothetical protein
MRSTVNKTGHACEEGGWTRTVGPLPEVCAERLAEKRRTTKIVEESRIRVSYGLGWAGSDTPKRYSAVAGDVTSRITGVRGRARHVILAACILVKSIFCIP